MKNNSVLTFVVSYIAYFFMIAMLCWVANGKTMDYQDCLHDDKVQTISILTGWIFALAVVLQDKK